MSNIITGSDEVNIPASVSFSINFPDFAKFHAFSKMKHMGQKRAGGEPYFEHVCRVALSTFVNDDGVLDASEITDARVAALLHDVVEDTDATLEDLTAIGASPRAVEAVSLLTRSSGVSYGDYVKRLVNADNRIATAVKLGDLTDNIRDAESVDNPKFWDLREKRWLPTYNKLITLWLAYPTID